MRHTTTEANKMTLLTTIAKRRGLTCKLTQELTDGEITGYYCAVIENSNGDILNCWKSGFKCSQIQVNVAENLIDAELDW